MILVLLFLIAGLVLFSPFAFFAVILQIAQNRRAAKAQESAEPIEA